MVLVARNKAVNLETVTFQSARKFGKHLHYVLWMPVHDGILQIETLQVRYGGRLYFLRETEHMAELGYFGDVKLDQQQLLL